MNGKEKECFLSILIPAHNEESGISETCAALVQGLSDANISDYEILVVNDHSTDRTESVLEGLAKTMPRVRYVNNDGGQGYGCAVRKGLDCYRGDAVAIVMGDLSDSPEDVIAYFREIKNGAECVFGSRFVAGSKVSNYPRFKYVVNRLANWFIKVGFRLDHNDITNAFKAYRREVIEGIQPLLSHHFNLTVEMPLKAIIRGYRYVAPPIAWTNRTTGQSKLRLREMGSRYLFIVLYCWLEWRLSKGDYRRRDRR